MVDYNPLVSVAVITYNSSKYVIETLESIKAQTYQNLELIVSDDCSTDNTVILCKDWIERNKERFVDVRIIVPENNTGIPANVNRAVRASKGIWFKAIAGDDILMDDAIENYVQYVNNHKEIQILFANMHHFTVNNDGKVVEFPDTIDGKTIDEFNRKTAHEQYLDLLLYRANTGGSPTAFAKRELFLKYPFNERYRGYEDVPQWIKLARSGVHLNRMDVYTVKYRRGESLTSSNSRFFSPIMVESKHQYFWNELRDYLIEENLYDMYINRQRELLMFDLTSCLTNNKKTTFNKIIYYIINLLAWRLKFPHWV